LLLLLLLLLLLVVVVVDDDVFVALSSVISESYLRGFEGSE
jgi:hypothetical protein